MTASKTSAYVRVAASKIHGKGLFARRDIPAQTLLGICQVKRVDAADLYTLTLDDGSMYDVTCELKYINHSKQANVSYYDDFSVVALVDIKAGQELLHDYGEEWS